MVQDSKVLQFISQRYKQDIFKSLNKSDDGYVTIDYNTNVIEPSQKIKEMLEKENCHEVKFRQRF